MFEYLKKLDRHSQLMQSMAGRVGVDLSEKVAEGGTAMRNYRQAVSRCMSCDGVEACQHWLAEHDHAEAAPEYCRNRAMFAELKD